MDESPTSHVNPGASEIDTICLPSPRVEFGRYELVRELGAGGMGVVWLAQDRALGTAIALKMLREQFTREPTAIRELKGEVVINRTLSHPNIVKTFDFVTNGRASAISMEYVDGTNLHRLKGSRPQGFFEPDDIAKWIAQLCAAMDYAHRQNVVHRDLKPANLLVDRLGDLKVGDFGIGRTVAETAMGMTRNSSGTPPYMSPQQTMGERALPSDDIYAIGATVYDLMTGDPPFFRGSIREQTLAKAPPSMGERRRELGRQGNPIPREWEAAVSAALSKEASGRPATAADLRASFEGRPVTVGAAARPVRRRRVLALWAAAGVGVVAGLAGWHWRRALAPALGRDGGAVTAQAAAPAAPVAARPAPAVASPSPSPVDALLSSGRISRDEAVLLRRALAGEQGDFEWVLAERLVRLHTLTPAQWRDYSALVPPPDLIAAKLRPLLMAGIIRENEFGWLAQALIGAKGPAEAKLATRLVDLRDLAPADWRAQTGLYPKPPVDPVVAKVAPFVAQGAVTATEGDWLESALRGERGANERDLASRLVEAKAITLGQWRARTALAYPAPKDGLADPSRWPPALDLVLAPGVSLRLLRVAAGPFVRGTPDDEPGRRSNEPEPAQVRIERPFFLGVYEVTQAQYTAIMPRNPSYWRGHPNWPVDQVDWDSLAGPDGFLARLNRSLADRFGGAIVADVPSNDEWEYAARAGTQGPFYRPASLSDLQRSPVLDRLANYGRPDSGSPQPVGSYEPNAWGFYDLLGNVAEWCRDRSVRGGSWESNAAGCRIGSRTQYDEGADYDPSPDQGFRLLLRAADRAP